MKAGQLLTYKKNTYRVVKAPNANIPCIGCAIHNTPNHSDTVCSIYICEFFEVPQNCNLKLVKECEKLEK